MFTRIFFLAGLLLNLSSCVNSDLSGGVREAPILDDPPVLQSIFPEVGSIIDPPIIEVHGRDFLSGTRVRIGNNLCGNKTFVNSQLITCRPPAGLAAGSYTVRVSHPDGSTSSKSNLYNAIPGPTITTISPLGGPPVGGAVELTVTGTNFQNLSNGQTTEVTIDGQACSLIAIDSSSQLRCSVPDFSGAPDPEGDLVDVEITNPGGVTGNTVSHEYLNDPVITLVAPAFGPTFSGAQVTITGNNFSPTMGAEVLFNGAIECSIDSITATSIECTLPGMSVGDYDVSVQNAFGSAVQVVDSYEVLPPPTVTDVFSYDIGEDEEFAPGGPFAGGTVLRLYGTNLRGSGIEVYLDDDDDNECHTVTSQPDGTMLTCITPPRVDPDGEVEKILVRTQGIEPGGVDRQNWFEYTPATGPSFLYIDDPVVTAFTPSVGPETLPTVITITGSNFTDFKSNPIVTMGSSSPCVITDPITDTEITCSVVNGDPDEADQKVSVQLSTGQTYTPDGALTDVFNFLRAPIISSIDSADFVIGDSDSFNLLISGQYFNNTGGLEITIGGIDCTNVVFNNDTSVECSPLPLLPPGVHDVVVINPDGQTATHQSFHVIGDPEILTISPNAGDPLGVTPVEITGANFVAYPFDTEVNIGGFPCANVDVISSTLLTCDVPAYDSGPTLVDVEVINDFSEGQIDTLSNGFQYQESPTVISLNPDYSNLAGGATLIITGTDFSDFGGAPVVFVDETPCVVDMGSFSPTNLECELPSMPDAGEYAVVVESASGQRSNEDVFITYLQAPNVSETLPRGSTLAGGGTINVLGSGFSTLGLGSEIMIGAQVCTLDTVVSSSELTCTLPAPIAAGYHQVVVTTEGGTSVEDVRFEARNPPTVSSISPSVISTAGDADIIVTGTNFSLNAPMTVTIDGASCTNVDVLSVNQIACTAPPRLEGSYQAIVTNTFSSAISAPGGNLDYVGSPTISGVSPSGGPLAGGNVITVSGTNFTTDGTTSVSVNSVACLSITPVSSTEIECTVPPHGVSEVVSVRVSNFSGTATLPGVYQYIDAPTLVSVQNIEEVWMKNYGSQTGGQLLRITGTNFTSHSGTLTVDIGGEDCGGLDLVDENTIECISPAVPDIGWQEVTVTTPSGQSATLLEGDQAYFAIGPIDVTAISPEARTSTNASPLEIIIQGENFADIDNDEFLIILTNGSGYTNDCDIQSMSDEEIICHYPLEDLVAGQYSLNMASPDNQVILNSNVFHILDPPVITHLTSSVGNPTGPATHFTVLHGENFPFNRFNLAGDPLLPVIRIDGEICTDPIVSSPTEVDCLVPENMSFGEVDVEITNPGNVALDGYFLLSNGYKYHPEPTITSISPDYASFRGGTTISIIGTNFTDFEDTPTVRIDGRDCIVNAGTFSDTFLSCVTPDFSDDIAELKDLVVFNAELNFSAPEAIEILPTPVLTSVTPSFVNQGDTPNIQINGSDIFDGAPSETEVEVGGLSCTNVVVSPTQVTCDLPVGLGIGVQEVTLFHPDGEVIILDDALEIIAAPTIAQVSPSGGPLGGLETITIEGTNFPLVNTPLILFTIGVDDYECTDVVVLSSTELTCLTPNLAGEGFTTPQTPDLTLEIGSFTTPPQSLYEFRDGPTFISIDPLFGSAAGGDVITIEGDNFSTFEGLPTVEIAGVECLIAGPGSVTEEEIICTTQGPMAAGSADVTITNPSGQFITANGQFNVLAAPILTSVTPNTMNEGSTPTVSFIGENFSNVGSGVQLRINGVPCSSSTYINSEQATCEVPGGLSEGVYPISLFNPDGVEATLADAFTVLPAVTVASISPVGGILAGGTTVTITGSNFSDNSGPPNVTLGGTACLSVNVNSPTELTCTPGNHGATAAIVDVNVNNVGSAVATLASAYEYRNQPTITSADPEYGPLGGNIVITLTGTNFSSFQAGPTVLVGSNQCTGVVVNSETELECLLPPGDSLGEFDILVTNATGFTTATPLAFEYVEPPSIASISPNIISSTVSTELTIMGTNFREDLEVYLESTLESLECTNVDLISENELTCNTPSTMTTGSYDVVVVHLDGQMGIEEDGLTVVAPPVVTSVSPAFGRLAGGDLISIIGSNFSPSPTVSFSAGGCTSVNFVSSTEIECTTTPNAIPGSVHVTVENTNGLSGTRTNGFTYISPPTISAIEPAVDIVGGGAVIEITGFNFEPGSVVIGGVPCAINSGTMTSTFVECTTGNFTDTGVYDLVFTNFDGQSDTATNGFTVTPDAEIDWTGGDGDFGTQSGFVTRTFTLSYISGTDSTSPLVITIVGPDESYWAIADGADNCTTSELDDTLLVSCTVDVRFRAGSATVPVGGPYEATLRASGQFMVPVELPLSGSKN